jgi:hypothetical protein
MLDPADPAAADLFSRQALTASASIQPLWRPLLIALLVVFMLDVAARRIAWDWPATWHWLVQRLDMLAGLLRPREVSSTATMAALKSKAQQVERKLSAPQAAQAAAKFEAQPGAVAQQDFAAAVGGATVAPANTNPTDAQTSGGSGGAPTTERLLEAKRRARNRLPATPGSPGTPGTNDQD